MTHNLKALRDLEKRLAEAKGPDRVLDFWIAVELGPNPLESDTGTTEARPGWVNDSGQEYELWNAAGRYGFIGHHVVPNLTASLDAAVALVERVLPHWHLCVQGVNDSWSARLNPTAFGKVGDGFANHATPALALCLAAVRALIAQGEQ